MRRQLEMVGIPRQRRGLGGVAVRRGRLRVNAVFDQTPGPKAGARAMSFGLEAMASCFQGIIPAMLFTCSQDGMPNAAFLSHVDYVDPNARGVVVPVLQQEPAQHRREPARAGARLDPDTSQGWSSPALCALGDRGPVFDRMHLRIEAIASYAAQRHLQAARRRHLRSAVGRSCPRSRGSRRRKTAGITPDAVFTMKALQDLSLRINTRAVSSTARFDPRRPRRVSPSTTR